MKLELGYVKRRKWSWTEKRLQQAKDVSDIVNDLIEYEPLTVRQIFYQLVAAGKRENTRSKYNDLSKLMTNMRVDGMLDWDIIDDRARRISDRIGFADAWEYVKLMCEALGNYQRRLVQGQDHYIETWCEKDALSMIFEDLSSDYCIQHATCRGFDSTTSLRKFVERAESAISQGQMPVLLYFGDFDPSGLAAGDATQQSLKERHGLNGIKFVRVALNQEQIEEHRLPHAFDAVKPTDSRTKRFVDRFGEYGACELDAIHPKLLREMTIEAIHSYLDKDLFWKQMEIESEERKKMAKLQERFLAEAKKILGEV